MLGVGPGSITIVLLGVALLKLGVLFWLVTASD